jgi:hypothetical protein
VLAAPADAGFEEAVENCGWVAPLVLGPQILDHLVEVQHDGGRPEPDARGEVGRRQRWSSPVLRGFHGRGREGRPGALDSARARERLVPLAAALEARPGSDHRELARMARQVATRLIPDPPSRQAQARQSIASPLAETT